MIRDRVSTIAIIAGLMAIIFAVLLLFLPPSFIHPVAAAIGAVLQIHKAGSEQKMKYLTVLVMFFILTFAYLAMAAPVSTGTVADTAPFPQIDTWLKEQGYSGAALIAIDGRVMLSKGYGYADRSRMIPTTSETIFRIGSNWKDITIHHLLTHTSGIPDFQSVFWLNSATEDEIIQRFMQEPLEFKPGERYGKYSNTGYILLGAIIEQASGRSYPEFLQENIFDPVNMTGSGYELNGDIGTVGYLNDYLKTFSLISPKSYAAGWMHSTAADLFLWDKELYTDRLIQQKSHDEMFTEQLSVHQFFIYFSGFFLICKPLQKRKTKLHGSPRTLGCHYVPILHNRSVNVLCIFQIGLHPPENSGFPACEDACFCKDCRPGADGGNHLSC